MAACQIRLILQGLARVSYRSGYRCANTVELLGQVLCCGNNVDMTLDIQSRRA